MQIAKRASIAGLVLLLALSVSAGAAPRVESNVVYGMYSGLALLVDVYYPEKPNGYGIVMIAGSGWHAPLNNQSEILAAELNKGGLMVNLIRVPGGGHDAAVVDLTAVVDFV